MAKITSYLLLLFVACLLVFARAAPAPIEDLAETTIDVIETLTSASTESFTVEVTRVDDLVDDDGELLAERLESVIIDFELSDDQLLVNNVPVQLGVTSITIIEAKIFAVSENTTDETIEELGDSFDIGLVTVEVSSSAESYPTDDPTYSLRRITIWTRIVEIDGVDIVQTDAVEKILEVKTLNVLDDDSEDLELVPASNDPSIADPAHNHAPCSLSTFAGRLRHWWRCASRFTRVVVASIFLTSVFGIVFIALPAGLHAIVMSHRQRCGRYSQVAVDDVVVLPVTPKVIYVADEEKRALMDQDRTEQS